MQLYWRRQQVKFSCWTKSLKYLLNFYLFINFSFWCNRTDSCDNDGVQTPPACQAKKSIMGYCELQIECLGRLGLTCYADRKQCDCIDLTKKYTKYKKFQINLNKFNPIF